MCSESPVGDMTVLYETLFIVYIMAVIIINEERLVSSRRFTIYNES